MYFNATRAGSWRIFLRMLRRVPLRSGRNGGWPGRRLYSEDIAEEEDKGKGEEGARAVTAGVAGVKLATGAELEFLGTSSACSTRTRNVSSLAFHYRKQGAGRGCESRV